MLKEYNVNEEKKLQNLWEKEKIYALKNTSRIFSIDTPPPYPSGSPWHIGAAAHYSQIDMIARTARMQGFDVSFPIGFDRNGLPVEKYTEKKYKIRMHLTNRERFVELCSKALDSLELEMLRIMKGMGMSCNFENYYRTDSADYRTLTQTTFIELWKKNLIYEATRPNNYCIDCGTTIADAEIIYEELQTELVYVKFRIKETGKDVIIATTRPELLCACQLVIFNPHDERYKEIEGKHIILPLYNREVKIERHQYAKQEFGTGMAMICSYGDYSDVRLFRELKLTEIVAINREGKMTKEAGKYGGLKIKDARKKIIEDLEKKGFLEKKENIKHRTPVCERCNMPIEIIPMSEFYLKQLDFKKKILEFSRKLKFMPERHRQLLIDWVNSVSIDWPISRRRYYGTEIPLWYCKKCHKPMLPKPGRYYQPWKQKFNGKCSCGSTEFIGEERTFDTWMDSSISALYVSKYKKDDKFFRIAFPCNIRPQGKEIIRTWLYYSLLRCFQLTGKCAFQNAWIMGWGVDEKGEKMSKSRGNVIDPIPLIEKYGGDAFRFWAASETSLGSDFRCSEARIQGASKFLNKLWNVAKFISSFEKISENEKIKLENLDEWIISELNRMIEECMKGYKQFNFFIPSNEIRNFVWNIFAPHYLELIKARAYAKNKSALFTLHHCLQKILILFAPVCPFMTDYIFRNLYGKSVNEEKFPFSLKGKKMPFSTAELCELNSVIWKFKKDKGLSLKEEILEFSIPKKFKIIEQDLKETHKIKKILWT